MFFPLYDENPRLRPPIVTKLIILACVLAWLLLQGAGDEDALVASLCKLGAIPGELTGRAAGQAIELGQATCVVGAQPHWYTLVTSLFLHGSWLHLIGNMWFLWIFGDNIEDRFGHVKYLGFYVFCGLVAAGAQIATDPSAAVPMIGASGAISGVMGAYVVLYPRVTVRTLVFLGFYFTVIRVPAYFILGFWFVLQLLSSLPQLGGAHGGVAFAAHVGGFLAGAVTALLVRSRRPVQLASS
jgi:membrane associated rhomboid family serine protease